MLTITNMERVQDILVLYQTSPALDTAPIAWARYEASKGAAIEDLIEESEPPYRNALAAMRDGWQVIQMSEYKQRSAKDGYMFKLRLNPARPQIRLFNTTGLDDPEIDSILSTAHGWEGDEMRYEIMKRVQLWRYVSGQPDYDMGERFLRRREYQPQKQTAPI